MEQFRICIRIQHPILLPSFKTKLFLNFSEGNSGRSKRMRKFLKVMGNVPQLGQLMT